MESELPGVLLALRMAFACSQCQIPDVIPGAGRTELEIPPQPHGWRSWPCQELGLWP